MKIKNQCRLVNQIFMSISLVPNNITREAGGDEKEA
jgi:hypothetical protein